MEREDTCRYCGEAVPIDGNLARHLDDAHDRSELSRIDKKRVDHHAQQTSQLQTLVGGRGISRRATLGLAGMAVAGGVIGFVGSTLASSHTELEDWNDLDAVRNDLTDDYKLVADLDQNTAGYSTHVGTGDGWDPIDDNIDASNPAASDAFSGTFDGQGHVIQDLVIDRPSEDPVGLFGGLANGTIKNVVLTDLDVTGEGGGSGGSGVGGLVGITGIDGSSNARIENCLITGTVAVTGDTARRVGGLSGYVRDGDVSNVGVSGDVTVTGPDQVGGVAGELLDGTIEDTYLYSTGTIEATDGTTGRAGGLVGSNDSTVQRSYAVGDVQGVDSGGAIGGTSGGASHTNVFWDEDVGPATSDGGDPLTTNEMTGTNAETNLTGFDFATPVWNAVIDGEAINPTPESDGYPILEAVDTETQLDAQGITWHSGGGSVGNVTIRDSTFKNNSVGVDFGDGS